MNGASPQLVIIHDHVVGDCVRRKARQTGGQRWTSRSSCRRCRRPARGTPAQKFWLEPEVPCLVAACVAALEAGEDHPSKPWKKLEVLGRASASTLAKNEVRGLMLLIALGRFPRPTAAGRDKDSGGSRALAILADAAGAAIRPDLGRSPAVLRRPLPRISGHARGRMRCSWSWRSASRA